MSYDHHLSTWVIGFPLLSKLHSIFTVAGPCGLDLCISH
jgi:hypothetical protein